MTLDAHRIAPLLKTQRYGRSLEVKDTTSSTMNDARIAAEQGAPDGHVVVADTQSAGRGSRGRQWDSPPGTDLYLSIVARTTLPLETLAPLTLAVGLGVCEVAADYGEALVKWPNDVWLGGRKCAGVLVESFGDVAIIGIGLNVNRTEWPEELRRTATSLFSASANVTNHPRSASPQGAKPGANAPPRPVQSTRPRREDYGGGGRAGQKLDRELILAQLLASVETRVDRFVANGPAPIANELNGLLTLKGQRVRCDDVVGILIGIAPSGAVRIETDTGIVERNAGRLEAD